MIIIPKLTITWRGIPHVQTHPGKDEFVIAYLPRILVRSHFTVVHSSLAPNPGPGGIPPRSRPGLVLLLELGCRTVPLSIAVRCDYQKRSLNYPGIWRSIHRKYVYDVYVLLWFKMFKVGCSKLLYITNIYTASTGSSGGPPSCPEFPIVKSFSRFSCPVSWMFFVTSGASSSRNRNANGRQLSY